MVIEDVAGVDGESVINTDWYKPDGSINYPPNNGAVPGTEVNITLKQGKSLGRYGAIGPESNFVTETGADANKLSLPPTADPNVYQEFEVIKEIPDTTQAVIAKWGGSDGGGLQYELPKPILQLIREGYLVPK
ncbi:TNT domain-containing protein [Pseudobutyrivibrio ruminis]|uniref:TNT domain-containing protein n=1 Tax=Pseudobutyrivibrio ruminis TaxID=46206 RepID=UPI001670D6EB|nr:TNT domain-containing protein [Pseudobutyrivibrio ruminis]